MKIIHMRNFGSYFLVRLLGLFLIASASQAHSPPFSGSVFIDPDLITSTDPSAYVSASDKGTGVRKVWDFRDSSFQQRTGYLYDLKFNDGPTVEAWVNMEFDNPEVEASKYGFYLGQMPRFLRNNLQQMWIHADIGSIGANSPYKTVPGHIVLHTGKAESRIAAGTLEETFLHELSHVELDPLYEDTTAWMDAAAADPTFISRYAQNNPDREDVAESFGAWFAVRQRAHKIPNVKARKILRAIPNRLKFFDELSLSMAPLRTHSVMTSPTSDTLDSLSQVFTWTEPAGFDKAGLIVGTRKPGDSNLERSKSIDSTTYALSGIPTNGDNVFVRLRSRVDGVWGYGDYLYTANAAPANPDGGTITDPKPGSTLERNQWVWFNHTAPASGDAPERYDILVGTTGPGSTNIKESGVLAGNKHGQWVWIDESSGPIHVRLWTRVENTWYRNDHIYN